MSKRLALVFLILLGGFILTVMVEFYDRQHYDKTTLKRLSEQIEDPVNQLETTLKDIIETNEFFARFMDFNLDVNPEILKTFAEDWRDKHPLVMSILSSTEYNVNFVYPLRGNERVVNLDYRLRPEQLSAIQLAVATDKTVIDAPVKLLQTGRAGVIIRTPYRLSSIQTSRGKSWGMVSMAIDLNRLLIETDLLHPASEFDVIIKKFGEGDQSVDVVGNSTNVARLHVTKTIEFPNSQWQVILSDNAVSSYSEMRSGLIRSTGVVLTLIVVFGLIRYSRRFGQFNSSTHGSALYSGVAFKTVMRLTLMLPFTLIIIVLNLFSYKASVQSAEELKQAQITEIAVQLQEKVSEFFSIPSNMLIYNTEQFRLGLVNPENPDQMLQSFHLQLRQQPLLTFLSIGTVNGEYFAASQPPKGDDRSVRIVEATLANDRLVNIYQANDLGQRSELLSVGNTHFDARTRPWFRSAIISDVVQWYPIYRYELEDSDGLYDTLGMGMASVIRDPEHEPLGVITADVALSQVDEFLASYMARLKGIAFLAETPSHALMASSAEEPTFFLNGDQTLRVSISESGNPVIRSVGRAMDSANTDEGNEFIEVDNDRYLVNWQTIQLPNGPALTLGVALPESHLVSPARSVMLSNVILTLFLWGVMLMTTLLLTRWFINPLQSLSDRLRRVAAEDWDAKPATPSRFAELEDIRQSTDLMASALKQKVDLLEINLQEKNQLLEEANEQLEALSTKDSVTGVANQQHFQYIFSQEWSRVGRSRQPLVMMILELDDFDQFVELFGREDGDEAVKLVAKVLNGTVRRTIDLVAHINPGQFAIIAPNTENGMILAENILRGIEYQGIVHPESESGVFTACVGVGVYAGDSEMTPEAFMASVEFALSQAQSGGKNRVVFADDEVAH